MPFSPLSYSFRQTVKNIKRDIKGLVKRRSKVEDNDVGQRLEAISSPITTISVSAAPIAGTVIHRPSGDLQQRLQNHVPTSELPTPIEYNTGVNHPNGIQEHAHILTSASTATTIISSLSASHPVHACSGIEAPALAIGFREASPECVQKHRRNISMASSALTFASDAAKIAVPSDEFTVIKKRRASFQERVRHSSRHIRLPSASTVASYQTEASYQTKTTIKVPSSATSVCSHSRVYSDYSMPNPPFPYAEANNMLMAWYKARPRATEDRWIQHGVFVILDQAFSYTPHNPIYSAVFGDSFLAIATKDSKYEYSNRHLISLYWALKGDRLGAVRAVERLLTNLYPDCYAHDLLHRFGEVPSVKVNLDDLRARLSTFLMPEY